MTQPLAGVRVLELATGVAGPYAGKLFADYGADVIKVEPPGGDEARRWGPFLDDAPDGDSSALFLHLNTNKRSVTLDLALPSGQDLLRRLVASVDVCLESFPPGTLAEWGLGFESLHGLNPSLVLTSVTPFGQDGPYRSYRATELELSAWGSMNISRTNDGRPVMLGGNLAQYQTGNVAAMATMAALLFAEAGGEGTHVDVAAIATQAGSASFTMINLLSYAYSGRTAVPTRPADTSAAMRAMGPFLNGTFRCADGSVMVTTLPPWAPRMVTALDDPDVTAILGDPSRWGEPDAIERIQAVAEQWFGSRTRAEAMADGQAVGWPVIAIQDPGDLVHDPHFVARGAIVEVEHPAAGTVVQLGAPFRMDDGWALRRPAPQLGEHDAEVFGEI